MQSDVVGEVDELIDVVDDVLTGLSRWFRGHAPCDCSRSNSKPSLLSSKIFVASVSNESIGEGDDDVVLGLQAERDYCTDLSWRAQAARSVRALTR